MQQRQAVTLREANQLLRKGLIDMTDGRRTMKLRESEETVVEQQRKEIMRFRVKVNCLQDFAKNDTKELNGDLMEPELT